MIITVFNFGHVTPACVTCIEDDQMSHGEIILFREALRCDSLLHVTDSEGPGFKHRLCPGFLDACSLSRERVFDPLRAREGEDCAEEEWYPTLVTPLPVWLFSGHFPTRRLA